MISNTWKEAFESRDNGQRRVIGLQNPAADWAKVCSEVPALDNRKDGLGYMKYSQRRLFFGESHEAAAEYAERN